MSKIESRDDLLDAEKYKEISKKLAKSEPVLFMPHYVTDITFCPVKRKKGKYAVAISGVLLDGRKVNVIIDVPLFFDVQVEPDQIDELLKKIREKHIDGDYRSSFMYEKYEEIKAKPLMELSLEMQTYLRLHYLKTSCRSNAIRLVRDLGFKTATDNKSKYYNVVSRNYNISWARWAEISEYQIIDDELFKDPCLFINVENYKNIDPKLATTKELMFPKLLVMSWDIETYSKYKNKIPLPESEDDEMMVVCINFNWYNSVLPSKRIAITRYSIPDSKKWQVENNMELIVSKTEKDFIKNFFIIWDNYNPDYVVHFNGFSYDEPWMITRATERYKLYNFITNKIVRMYPYQDIDNAQKFGKYYKRGIYKIDAETTREFNFLSGYGFIGLDMMLLYKKIHPKLDKHGLKNFLEAEKIKSKDDMPYGVMHNFFKKLHSYKKMYKWEKETGTDTEKEYKFLLEKEDEKDKSWYEMPMSDVLTAITEYCAVDALRCQDLLRVRNLVMDKQNMASTAFISVQESFYNADSMKVVNITLGEAFRRNYLGSSISDGEAFAGKYEGAHVIPPIQGVYAPKLTIRERVFKAYEIKSKPFLKNLEMEEWEIEELTKLTQEQANLTKEIHLKYSDFGAEFSEKQIDSFIEEKFGIKPDQIEESRKLIPKCLRKFLIEKIKRGNFGLDFASLYPSLIMCYNLSPEMMTVNKKVAMEKAKSEVMKRIEFLHNGDPIKSWAVQHNGIQDPNDPGYKLGIFPTILLDLFNKRLIYKKELAIFKDKKEEFLKLSAEEQKEKSEEYEILCARCNYADAKQNTVKLLMNTFYGTVGSRINALCRLDLAAAVTLFGREHIKHAKQIVEDILGHTVLYGDTDSLYISPNSKLFLELDREHYFSDENINININTDTGTNSSIDQNSKYNFIKKSIEKIMSIFKHVQETVNSEIIKKSGNRFLSMAYEEVLYPAAFLSRKKYLGLKHVGAAIVDIKNPKDQIFMRGVDLVKRNVSQMAKTIGWSIITRLMSHDNYYSIMELVHIEIDNAFNRDWKPRDFATKATYKADKQNVKMHTFVKYLDEKYGIKIEDGEMLYYVVVKKDESCNFDGSRKEYKVGDHMELLSVAEEQGMKIDLMYYMSKSVCGQLARLISFYPDFYVVPVNDSTQASKDAGTKSFELAKKYIKSIMDTYIPKEVKTNRQKQKNYRAITKIIGSEMRKNRLPVIITTNKFNLNSTINFRTSLLEYVDKRADSMLDGYIDSFFKILKKVFPKEEHELINYRIYQNYAKNKKRVNDYKIRMIRLDKEREELLKKLDSKIFEFKGIFDDQRRYIEENAIETELDFKTEVQDDPEVMHQIVSKISDLTEDPVCIEFRKLYVGILANKFEIRKLEHISERITVIRESETGHITAEPKPVDFSGMDFGL